MQSLYNSSRHAEIDNLRQRVYGNAFWDSGPGIEARPLREWLLNYEESVKEAQFVWQEAETELINLVGWKGMIELVVRKLVEAELVKLW